MKPWFLPDGVSLSSSAPRIAASEEICLLALSSLSWHTWESRHSAYLLSGSTPGVMELQGVRVQFPPASVLCLPPRTPWYVPNGHRRSMSLLIVNGELELTLRLTLGICSAFAPTPVPQPVGPAVAPLLREFEQERERESPAATLVSRSVARILVVELLRSCYPDCDESLLPAARSALRPEVRRAVELLHANHRRQITITELAWVASLSPSYFLRLFTQEVGCTPHSYLTRLRVLRARELLLAMPEADLETIADLSGFRGTSQLHRAFRRHANLTPQSYRRGCAD